MGSVRRVNSDSDFLGRCKVSKSFPALVDDLVLGPPKMQGGGGGMICLDVALPLGLRVTHVKDFLEAAV